MNVPDDLHYAVSHEWIRLDGANGTVGITDHAQHELSDVVYVELPQVKAQVKAGQQVCVVESVKAASDIYSPISGTITAVNEALTANPALINSDPYGEGWIFRITVEAGEELEELKNAALLLLILIRILIFCPHIPLGAGGSRSRSRSGSRSRDQGQEASPRITPACVRCFAALNL
jgi:glycine cleavage system H protein